MTTFRWKKSPQYLNNSTQFRWKMEIQRLDPLPSPVYSKSPTCSILVDRKNPHGGKVWSEPDFHSAYFGGSKNPHGGKKVWAEPDFHSAYFGGSKNPHGGKKSMVRTRLPLSLFWWIEKSTRWKKSMVRTRLPLSLFWWIEKSTRWKKSMGRTRLPLSLFWWIEKSTRWKKKAWAEPDFDSAYFGGSKKEKHVAKQVGILQNVKFWYSTELVSSGKNYLNL